MALIMLLLVVSLIRILGTDGTDNWRVIAFMPSAQYDAVVTQWQIAGVAPSFIQISQAGIIGHELHRLRYRLKKCPS
eukprot:2312242-Amphidinium_carterae.1